MAWSGLVESRANLSEAKQFQDGITQALEAPPPDAASLTLARHLLVQIIAIRSGEAVIEQFLLPHQIGAEGFATADSVRCRRAKSHRRGLIDAATRSSALKADAARSAHDKRARPMDTR